ncbi:hypothetical protein M6D93_09635 [Jatrophihabitans telluris]|uniref:Uncharacterized protein n=1 Tax=Jatrophihabitans telluris TaxID=2038343 RepID=A0ABY4R5X3_9ACTN|nr:hypothetical protein [Jatrophihabitans telluris]UQX90241.1 hypothetical protein M6D93_09635 [Jatrophihabitans telluris]
MNSSPQRILARLAEAVRAAHDQDATAFAAAVTELESLDLERVSLALAESLRQALEELHPDGLAGDDVREALEHCVRSVSAWWPQLAVEALIATYTAALGMSDPESEQAGSSRLVLVTAGLLALADLLSDRAALAPGYLQAGLAEIERAETMEMP